MPTNKTQFKTICKHFRWGTAKGPVTVFKSSSCGVCQSRRNNNNNRNPGDPALERFNINTSVVFVAYIIFVVYILNPN